MRRVYRISQLGSALGGALLLGTIVLFAGCGPKQPINKGGDTPPVTNGDKPPDKSKDGKRIDQPPVSEPPQDKSPSQLQAERFELAKELTEVYKKVKFTGDQRAKIKELEAKFNEAEQKFKALPLDQRRDLEIRDATEWTQVYATYQKTKEKVRKYLVKDEG